MFVAALEVDLRLPSCHSLKDKRGTIRPILDGARNRLRVASSEVADQDKWQRARLGFAVVGGTAGQVEEVLDGLERFIWSFPEVEVLDAERTWLDTE